MAVRFPAGLGVRMAVLVSVPTAVWVRMAVRLGHTLTRLRRSAMPVVVTVAQGQCHAGNEPNGPRGDHTAA